MLRQSVLLVSKLPLMVINNYNYKSTHQSKIKVPADSVPDEKLFLVLSLCPHIMEKEGSGICSTCEDTNPNMGALLS